VSACVCRDISFWDAHPPNVPWQVLFTGKAVRVLLRRGFAPPPPERVQDEVDTLRPSEFLGKAIRESENGWGWLVSFCREQSKQNDRLICDGFRCFGSESGSNSFCRQHYTSCKGRKNHVQSGRNIWDRDLRLVNMVFVQRGSLVFKDPHESSLQVVSSKQPKMRDV